ncbi:prenyltransferase/squalene oxidase repeat-containing protein [Chitinophaga sp. Cy-1792]|uniref:prenyltransferase/squalene oxidase repeat-containing protein n=1 Tax=Chitinophaga sp. Cy-1792 TaxID=2608339 RepID=UPI001422DBAA|nr:prenyltransferase/squalene oxidase repeat-containing protein [Chitinophaga sp. Cy-1792]NIG55371.1 terpene cyclase/mutase family protein [Chitinophaga sp. Cy-1792]
MNNFPGNYSLLKATGNFFKGLPDCLVTNKQSDILQRTADFFPPVIRFALECRMNHEQQVDLQFCIRRDEDNLPAIYNWFQAQSTADGDYHRLLRFLEKWMDTSSCYHQYIPEIFLEADVLPAGIKTPLLFFELPSHLSGSQAKDTCSAVLNDILGDNLPFSNMLNKIIEHCSGTAYVAYLGIQFSRDVAALRVNVKNLMVDEINPFLKEIGYPGTGPELDSYISLIYNYADKVTLCIDISDNVLPGIGFECFWNAPPQKDGYWRYLIEQLNALQAFDHSKIDAVLQWDKEIFPGQIKEWPEHLWLESLQRKEYEFVFLKQWISHLKVSYSPGKNIDLKAYLGYESKWKTFKSTVAEDADVMQHCTHTAIVQAISKGTDFILSNQQQSGWWKDYYVSIGTSDEWVTAYVACHLARLNDAKSQRALHRAWKILKTRYRENEGWGFNALIPTDADSTIWTWLFAVTAQFSHEFPTAGFSIMHAYQDEEGGVISYSLNGRVGRITREQNHNYFNGWQIPHFCVTAAYALAGEQLAIEYLLKHQKPEGYWYSYWWKGPEYATAISTEALYNKNAEKYREIIIAAVNWAMNHAQLALNSHLPNPFKLALLLKTILCSPAKIEKKELLSAMVCHLLHTQEASGSWPASAEMRMPDPDNTKHEADENIKFFKDERKNFSTITILDALHKYNAYQYLPVTRL